MMARSALEWRTLETRFAQAIEDTHDRALVGERRDLEVGGKRVSRHLRERGLRLISESDDLCADAGEPTLNLMPAILDAAVDAGAEDEAIAAYNGFLKVCRDNGDSVTAKLFEDVIDEEQAHFNYFDNINDHIEKLGNVYLAKIAGTSSARHWPSP